MALVDSCYSKVYNDHVLNYWKSFALQMLRVGIYHVISGILQHRVDALFFQSSLQPVSFRRFYHVDGRKDQIHVQAGRILLEQRRTLVRCGVTSQEFYNI